MIFIVSTVKQLLYAAISSDHEVVDAVARGVASLAIHGADV